MDDEFKKELEKHARAMFDLMSNGDTTADKRVAEVAFGLAQAGHHAMALACLNNTRDSEVTGVAHSTVARHEFTKLLIGDPATHSKFNTWLNAEFKAHRGQ